MKKINHLLAKGMATQLVLGSFTMPGLMKTRGFVGLMNRIFSKIAPSYDRIWTDLAPESVFLGPLTAAARSLKAAPLRILDLACGTGLATLHLGRLFPESQVVGADLSERMIQVMEQKMKSAGLRYLQTLVCNSDRLPFEDGLFDLVLTQNAPPYLEEMVRVLRPGGRLLLAYSFVMVPLVRGVMARRLEGLGLEDLNFIQAEQGLAVTAGKPDRTHA